METHSSSESVPVSRPPAVLLLGACFFLSGATGLVYQVVWLRMLGLVFGHTVYATTTVLVAFMAGLGLGSYLLARHVHRLRDLIAAYGWLEIGIGIYCAILPPLLAGAATAYIALHRALGLSYEVFSLVQFGLVVVILLVPTTFMGGTLPVLGQALSRDQVGLGRTIGALYAVNTFGAVAGVALAGYVLLPALGNRRTLLIAAAANLAVGALALAYARTRRGRARDILVTGAGADALARPSPLGPDARLTLIALGISGGISMIYEVAWTRALGLIVGSSTFAFTAMLLAFLIGIAGGSAAYSWIWGNRRDAAHLRRAPGGDRARHAGRDAPLRAASPLLPGGPSVVGFAARDTAHPARDLRRHPRGDDGIHRGDLSRRGGGGLTRRGPCRPGCGPDLCHQHGGLHRREHPGRIRADSRRGPPRLAAPRGGRQLPPRRAAVRDAVVTHLHGPRRPGHGGRARSPGHLPRAALELRRARERRVRLCPGLSPKRVEPVALAPHRHRRHHLLS